MWRQAYNIRSAGINQMYFAMFDEYDEGTAIMKAATDWSMIPTNQYFVTLSADGIWVSSDYYLRVAGAATAMVKSSDEPSQATYQFLIPGDLIITGTVLKRDIPNILKKKVVKLKMGYSIWIHAFYNPAILGSINVTMPTCEITLDESNANSGSYYVQASGNPTSVNITHLSVINYAEVKIPVVADLQLSFRKKTINELGQYVSVDLLFKSGKKLSKLTGYGNNLGVEHGSIIRD
ncbi:MAG: hypothetical protein MZV63_13745 [Marinilabiliales bacterium]|nr:hypothetical protein [Marinilabiliales bacterium]